MHPIPPRSQARDHIQAKQDGEDSTSGRASGPGQWTLRQGQLEKAVSVALFSSTSCFS